jgi:oligoribonuclease NrnB/cAMP/cGMP phosphodiesterase (DHH superfamily)
MEALWGWSAPVASIGFMEIFNVTHEADLDGLACPALLMGTYGIKKKNILFSDHRQDAIDKLEKNVLALSPKDSTFIFTDLSVGESDYTQMKRILGYLKKRNNSIRVIDHHHWSPKEFKGIEPMCDLIVIGENKYKCATELVHTLLCNGSKRYAELAEITHISDFALNSKKYDALVWKIAASIRQIRNTFKNPDPILKEIVVQFSKGNIDNVIVNKYFKAYQKESAMNKKILNENTFIIDGKKAKIAIGFSKNLHSGEAGGELMKKTGCNIAIYVNTVAGQASMRSKKGYDCIRIADGEGGGGHPQAAGFRAEKREYHNFDAKGMESFVSHIRSRYA